MFVVVKILISCLTELWILFMKHEKVFVKHNEWTVLIDFWGIIYNLLNNIVVPSTFRKSFSTKLNRIISPFISRFLLPSAAIEISWIYLWSKARTLHWDGKLVVYVILKCDERVRYLFPGKLCMMCYLIIIYVLLLDVNKLSILEGKWLDFPIKHFFFLFFSFEQQTNYETSLWCLSVVICDALGNFVGFSQNQFTRQGYIFEVGFVSSENS